MQTRKILRVRKCQEEEEVLQAQLQISSGCPPPPSPQFEVQIHNKRSYWLRMILSIYCDKPTKEDTKGIKQPEHMSTALMLRFIS